eukprot:305486-Chlamydomonas_euryale.AAC.3
MHMRVMLCTRCSESSMHTHVMLYKGRCLQWALLTKGPPPPPNGPPKQLHIRRKRHCEPAPMQPPLSATSLQDRAPPQTSGDTTHLHRLTSSFRVAAPRQRPRAPRAASYTRTQPIPHPSLPCRAKRPRPSGGSMQPHPTDSPPPPSPAGQRAHARRAAAYTRTRSWRVTAAAGTTWVPATRSDGASDANSTVLAAEPVVRSVASLVAASSPLYRGSSGERNDSGPLHSHRTPCVEMWMCECHDCDD